MAHLDEQFYDQLSQRLNRQDAALERIEQGQASLLDCMNDHKTKLAAHIASDKSNDSWIVYIFSGVWAVLAGIIAYLGAHK